MGQFEELQKKTIELLAAKASNYALPPLEDEDTTTEAEDPSKDGEARRETDLDANTLYDCLVDLYECEKENIADGVTEESEEIAFLRNCVKRMAILKERYGKCIETVNDLRMNYETVTERTCSLHNACDRMMAYQTQIAAGAEQIRANLFYYTQCDTIMKKLNSGKFSATGQVFTQILSTIDECLSFLRNHMHYKESATYIIKYEQCLSKAMTGIRTSVMADLEASWNIVKDRQAQLEVDNRHSAYADDDTFALLYGVFAAKANSVRSALELAEQHFRELPEYQSMAADCQQAYFNIRKQMLEAVIKRTIEELMKRHADSSCALTRNGCAFLLQLCDDEFRLYKQFFVIEEEGSTARSVTSSVPSSPVPLVLAPFISTTTSFDDFIESLCRVFYDILRPIIIHNPHLETLAELCTILKVEMIEERCGIIQAFLSPANGTTPTDSDETIMNPRAGFVRVMSELVGDVAERIVYRAGLYGTSDIADYNPSTGDLAYPEKLEMMKAIEEEHNEKKEGKVDHNAATTTSAIDLHCLWYPTVRRTVLCLSKIYKCLESAVFQSLARELLTVCCQSLVDAAERIRNNAAEKYPRSRRALDAELFVVKHLLILREQISPYRVVVPPGSNYNDSIPQRDYAIDLMKYKDSAAHLLQERHRWFELTSNNAFLEFLLQVPVAVTESSGDSRRIIDVHLKEHCHKLINIASDMVIFEFADYMNKANVASSEPDFDVRRIEFLHANNMQNFSGQAYKKLTHSWPEIRKCFDLYIGVKETEDILLQPIKKKIIDVFMRALVFVDKYYDDEQRQIAGLPSQEHIWLVLNS